LREVVSIMAWYGDERVQLIRDYVALRRQQLGIQAELGYKLEFSCEAFGEFRNLLDVQLLSTPEFLDGWLELRESETRPYDPIVDGVLEEVRKNVERQLEREPTQEWLSLAARLGRRGSA
jgi:hypothetical protein